MEVCGTRYDGTIGKDVLKMEPENRLRGRLKRIFMDVVREGTWLV